MAAERVIYHQICWLFRANSALSRMGIMWNRSGMNVKDLLKLRRAPAVSLAVDGYKCLAWVFLPQGDRILPASEEISFGEHLGGWGVRSEDRHAQPIAICGFARDSRIDQMVAQLAILTPGAPGSR